MRDYRHALGIRRIPRAWGITEELASSYQWKEFMESQNSNKLTLRAEAIGKLGAIALGVAMMGPALAIYANLGPVAASAGIASPAVFLIALLLTLPSAASYALMSREVPSAGSAYTWLSKSINPFVGTWMGLLVIATYFIAVILQPILFGLFFNELLALFYPSLVGYGSWMIGVLLSTAIVASLAYPGIDISAKGSTAITILGLIVIIGLASTILVSSLGSGTLRFTPFNPLKTLGGAQGFFNGLVFALLSFVGFSVITTAAEETHSPRSVIPQVVISACIFLGIIWAFSAWGFCLALPSAAWGGYVSKGVNPVGMLANRYWGRGSIIVTMTALAAVLGVYLASAVGCARVAYAMGRDGTLPAFFGRLHPKYQIPWNAQHLVFCTTIIVAAIWGRWLGLFLSYEWWGASLVFFAMISNAVVNLGCAVFFFRFRRNIFNWWWHGILPGIGLSSSFLPLYYCFGPDLWKAGWAKGQSIVVFSVGLIIANALYTVGLGLFKPEVLHGSTLRRNPASAVHSETH